MKNIIANPLLAKSHSKNRTRILRQFPDLANCGHDDYLFLHKYLDTSPFKFFNEQVYDQYLSLLLDRDNADQSALQQYMDNHSSDLSSAIMHLEEISALPWHDDPLPNNDIERIRFFDQKMNPSYLRLIESVLARLLHPVAYFNRLDRKKGINQLDVWNIIEEIKGGKLDHATRSYNNVVRNGIAHGGIVYSNTGITYKDKKGNKQEFSYFDLCRLYDDLLDTCNSLVLGISIFLLIRKADGYKLPQQLFFEELRARTKTPYWHIEACIPSISMKGDQLNLYAHGTSIDYRKIQMSVFQTGILAGILAGGYDRYFVSIHQPKGLPGWAAFNGARINELSEKADASIADCRGILEDNLVFFIPRFKLPMILGKINTFIISIKLNLPLVIAEVRKDMPTISIDVRNISSHRNGWRLVVNGELFISGQGIEINRTVLISSLKRVIRKALNRARGKIGYWKIQRYLPLGFVRLSIFDKDFRRRRLSGYGLGPHLVSTIQINRISRIKSPDLFGSTIETIGRYRIAWNKSWLERMGTSKT